MKECEYFDLQADAEIGHHLLTYSNFPELPQVYIDGQLIGGTEIIDALDNIGELERIIQEAKDKRDATNPKQEDYNAIVQMKKIKSD